MADMKNTESALVPENVAWEAGHLINDQISNREAKKGKPFKSRNRVAGELIGLAVEAGEKITQSESTSFTDALTGLPNRRAIDIALDREVAKAQRLELPLAIAMMDVNGFKGVNDQWGHAVGDQVLTKMVKIIQERRGVRETDFFARYGGDEFVMIMPGNDQEKAVSAVLRVLNLLVNNPVKIDDHELRIQFSVGVSVLKEGDNEKNLLTKADKLQYAAKGEKEKGGTIAFRKEDNTVGMVIVENRSVG